MKYELLNEEYGLSFIERLLKIRTVASDVDAFFQPTLGNSWIDPFLLNDMEKAVDHIITAMKKNHKIMVFGDYDVDGITSSYSVYKFLRYFLQYPNVSIMYPSRREDGYGLKVKHLEMMKEKNIDLVITVDNGITSIEEAFYAKTLGIDLIVTDHHHPLNELPSAIAVVNPSCSPRYPFKGLAGVGVAFKLIMAILSKTTLDVKRKNQIFHFFLPIVAIGTVADIVPLLSENRFMVKKGLELINSSADTLPPALKGFLSYLNIKSPIDTFHIGFMIGPRINAGGRMESPYDSLNIFLHEGEEQVAFLEKIDAINTERRKTQEQGVKIAETMINPEGSLLCAYSEEFHEGVIGIIAGRLTEKYYKPSIVFKIEPEKGTASASLRGPAYFNVIDMILAHEELLERYGGHKGAGGLTVKIENLALLCEKMERYCVDKIQISDLEKVISVDTKIFPHEWIEDNLSYLEKFAPFGEGNKEPLFLFEDLEVHRVEKVGNKGNGHMKIYAYRGEMLMSLLFWGKGADCELVPSQISVIGSIKRDTFNGGYFIDGTQILE
ncbi:MAG: single-stranded-DNA-specific exonuclease RecJ [Candidatus Absconditabacteria bacterium]|nr:single-stranded-DNA-specific exonuclease RecJ [Candidatus Absconditabacteria bacterium]MDD3868091.1 single-stranded-DNA-specific exonuclease RecJ [Candidatus Absconditabacteria bacterium]MDD4714338.1 single-stranded-DNA-specific exonuclease RecJ [Candidatus Absconditabacteria bacterium]